jgi:hypothetical protein
MNIPDKCKHTFAFLSTPKKPALQSASLLYICRTKNYQTNRT